jgi:hypothetical protein
VGERGFLKPPLVWAMFSVNHGMGYDPGSPDKGFIQQNSLPPS